MAPSREHQSRRHIPNLLLAAVLLLFTGGGSGIRTASALPIEGSIAVAPNIPPPQTKVILNGGRYATLTAADGSFLFPDVPAGTYLLEVLSPQYYFSQIKISVRPEAEAEEGKILCLEYKYPGATKLEAAYPLLLRAHSEYQYFERRNPYGALVAQLMSPMTWMLLISVGAAYYMPKMMEGLSEEERKKLQEGSDPQALMRELFGGGGGAGDAGSGGGQGGAGAASAGAVARAGAGGRSG